MSRQQIFITGSAGWLGSRLVEVMCNRIADVPGLEAIDPDSEIHCFIQPGQDLGVRDDRIRLFVGDLRRTEDVRQWMSLARPGALAFHTAGIIHPRRVREFYEINVEGTRNVLEAAIRHNFRRGIFISSNSPCGNNPHPDHRFDKESPYRPYQNYGRSKMMMELLIREASREARIETVVLRPPWFYGPNQPARQTLFFSMIRNGKVPILGNGGRLRSMAYVDNIIQGMLLAAVRPEASGRTYWIADDRPYAFSEIVQTVESVLEEDFGLSCRKKRLYLPAAVGDIAQLADGLIQRAGFYHQKIHVLSEMNKTIACTIEEAQVELGYSPKIALREGMRRSIDYCLRKGIAIE